MSTFCTLVNGVTTSFEANDPPVLVVFFVVQGCRCRTSAHCLLSKFVPKYRLSFCWSLLVILTGTVMLFGVDRL